MAVTNLTIKLDGLELNDRQLSALEKEVNSVVLKHIAATTQTKVVGSITKIRPEWLGIWIKTFKDKIALKENKFKNFPTQGGVL
jgi:hypothetical protein